MWEHREVNIVAAAHCLPLRTWPGFDLAWHLRVTPTEAAGCCSSDGPAGILLVWSSIWVPSSRGARRGCFTRLVIDADLLGDFLEKSQHLPESHGSPMEEHSSPLSFHHPVRPKQKGQRCQHQGAAMGVKAECHSVAECQGREENCGSKHSVLEQKWLPKSLSSANCGYARWVGCPWSGIHILSSRYDTPHWNAGSQRVCNTVTFSRAVLLWTLNETREQGSEGTRCWFPRNWYPVLKASMRMLTFYTFL